MEVASSSLVARSKKPIAKAIGFFINIEYAPVMELVDMRDLGSRVGRRVGSSPFRRTITDTVLIQSCQLRYLLFYALFSENMVFS